MSAPARIGICSPFNRSSIVEQCKAFAAATRQPTAGDHTPRTIVAYFYFDFRDQAQLSRNMLLSLILQLHVTDIQLMRVKELRKKYPLVASIPIADLVTLLLDMSVEFDQVIILLDALDECEDSPQLYEALKAIMSDDATKDIVQILATSRDEIRIQQALSAISFDRFPLSPVSVHQDLKLYIQEQVYVDAARRFAGFPDDVKTEIAEKLSSQYQGM
jgi:hypothetical protein